MEKKNLLHTEQVQSKNRTYYFDLKVAENGRQFLAINQTKSNEEGVTERAKMVLFEEDLTRFSQALLQSLLYFEAEKGPRIDDAYIQNVRKEHPNAFQRWSKEDEELLKELYQQGHQVEELMTHFKRNERGIITRLEMMGVALHSSTPAA